jgi:hypothetical protein
LALQLQAQICTNQRSGSSATPEENRQQLPHVPPRELPCGPEDWRSLIDELPPE